MAENNRFSHFVSIFQGWHLPENNAQLVGYSALIRSYELAVPLPDVLSAISHKHHKYQQDNWMMFTPRHVPKATLQGHLVFALKHEGVNLMVLKALFDCIEPAEIIQLIQQEPTGSYSRRIWFLYEWLQQTRLDLEDARKGNFVDVLDAKLQYPGSSRSVKRQRVRNNLPGVPGFCPLIRKTVTLEKFINMNFSECAKKNMEAVHPDILSRAAAFMLLKDSKASYAIEGETPPQNRAQRWGKAIGQAGMHALSHEEFLRLQSIVIEDFRFVHYGYRNEGGFIGDHERVSGRPIPDHISAKAQDIYTLMEGLIETDTLLKESELDPVLAAALIAFGFVFIHPFEDGNGRVHRYLIHHVLAEKNFTAKGVIFPVSAVILEKITQYRETLESYSRPRLKFIHWFPTEKGNVEVHNETIDLYRYFDATKQAEFLYECIQKTVEETLPEEVNYLKNYDAMKQFMVNYIDMPDKTIDLLIRFLIQNNGKFSKRATQKEFSSLTDEEIKTIENKFIELFS